jgi:serine/threonine kinase 32
MNKDGHLLLTDFNLCANLEEKVPTSSSGSQPYLGNDLPYKAPEMLTKKPYTYSVDWWATGIILYECTYGFVTLNLRSAHSKLKERGQSMISKRSP